MIDEFCCSLPITCFSVVDYIKNLGYLLSLTIYIYRFYLFSTYLNPNRPCQPENSEKAYDFPQTWQSVDKIFPRVIRCSIQGLNPRSRWWPAVAEMTAPPKPRSIYDVLWKSKRYLSLCRLLIFPLFASCFSLMSKTLMTNLSNSLMTCIRSFREVDVLFNSRSVI